MAIPPSSFPVQDQLKNFWGGARRRSAGFDPICDVGARPLSGTEKR